MSAQQASPTFETRQAMRRGSNSIGWIGGSFLKRIQTVIVGVLCALSGVGASASRRTQITEQALLYTGEDFGVRVYEPTKPGPAK